ncbi:beta-ketoacyl synthase N-terminal-like domain-containing protein [Streptomyces sp. NPDC050560]|uniref:beta-ketoacyl synthase N-terminal-like domain-containing protein n=1 Tax=Streptomyces sp. NPDC050560 TaxID=3365630 RepID=UPI0037BDA3FC
MDTVTPVPLRAEDPVAVIGMALRLPGADTPDAFWRNLREGVESVTEFSDADLLAAGVPPEALHDPARVRARPVVEGPELFDADFFGYSPAEAAAIDPQHRLFLECAWEALESAGHDPRGDGDLSVSVFAGTGPDSYFLNHLHPHRARAGQGPSFEGLLGNSGDFLASRVSYKLDLTGASVTVQAGCSTSLVAVHLAAASLITGESDLALAGGSTLYFPQRAGYLYREGGINSPDGRCRAFDARAAGTTPGDGVTVLVLRRLADALDAGDPVLGVLRGSAVNNDGAAKAGFTAPAVDPQSDVAAEALAVAGLSPSDIDYVEAHGTGTPMGDALEITALTEGYAGAPRGGCRIGTAKPNVGDTWAAAGAVGLAKVLLAFAHEELPPTINRSGPHPDIDFTAGPFTLTTEPTPFKRGERPRRAAVHTFGVGGTNAHVVLEEPPPVPPSPPEATGWYALPLSARDPDALTAVAARLADHLGARHDLALADVAHTLAVGRTPFAHRAVVVAGGRREAVTALRALAAAGPGAESAVGEGWLVVRAIGAPPAAPEGLSRGTVRAAATWAGGGRIWQGPPPPGPARRVALPTYPFRRRRHWVDPPAPAAAAAVDAAAPERERHPRPALGTVHTPPEEGLETLVAQVWQDALGFTGLGRDDDFFDLGGHSLLASRIVGSLRGRLPVPTGLDDLLTAPATVAGHARRLAARLHAELATLTDEEAARLAAGLG